jgi:fucose permease
VGAEFGLGSWVSTYTRETADAGVFEGAVLTAGYWFALALGRVASGMYFGRGHSALALLAFVSAAGGIASLVLALSSGNIVIAAISVFAAGFFFGPMWPSVLAIASHGAMGSATAATVTIGNAGGLVLPWLQGLVLVGAGPAEGVAMTAVLCALMLAITLAFRARHTVEPAVSISRV